MIVVDETPRLVRGRGRRAGAEGGGAGRGRGGGQGGGRLTEAANGPEERLTLCGGRGDKSYALLSHLRYFGVIFSPSSEPSADEP